MNVEEQAMYLLSSTNMGTVEVARTLGVSPGLISQFKGDTNFTKMVEERRSTISISKIQRDDRIDSLEDLILSKLEDTIPLTFKPMEVIRMAQVINGMERRSHKEDINPSLGEDANIVSIRLPKHVSEAVIAIKLNTQNEIVEVGDRALISMPAQGVMESLENQKKGKEVKKLESQKSLEEQEIEALVATF